MQARRIMIILLVKSTASAAAAAETAPIPAVFPAWMAIAPRIVASTHDGLIAAGASVAAEPTTRSPAEIVAPRRMSRLRSR